MRKISAPRDERGGSAGAAAVPPAAAPIRIRVTQDGRDFYWDDGDHAKCSISAPDGMVKNDFDMVGAERAFEWFIAWCQEHNYKPEFLTIEDQLREAAP